MPGNHDDAGSGLIPAHAGKTPERVPVAMPARAHPRSRGENNSLRVVPVVGVGSSPLTRGKHKVRIFEQLRLRLIPAHAGKTRSSLARSDQPWAHPRSRGENEVAGSSPVGGAGSSPLTRGKPEMGRLPRRTPGLIPAHAGKTRRSLSTAKTARAHPRSRGENPFEQMSAHGSRGSSPLTRGKQACSHKAIAKVVAHPRSRGENATLLLFSSHIGGSSPLTRGKHCGPSHG